MCMSGSTRSSHSAEAAPQLHVQTRGEIDDGAAFRAGVTKAFASAGRNVPGVAETASSMGSSNEGRVGSTLLCWRISTSLQ